MKLNVLIVPILFALFLFCAELINHNNNDNYVDIWQIKTATIQDINSALCIITDQYNYDISLSRNDFLLYVATTCTGQVGDVWKAHCNWRLDTLTISGNRVSSSFNDMLSNIFLIDSIQYKDKINITVIGGGQKANIDIDSIPNFPEVIGYKRIFKQQ
jgi:hypothetical protein